MSSSEGPKQASGWCCPGLLYMYGAPELELENSCFLESPKTFIKAIFLLSCYISDNKIKISCIPNWPQTHSVGETDLELLVILLSLPGCWDERLTITSSKE